MDDDKLLEKNRVIWTKIKDLKTVKLNTFMIYYDRYMKIKMRTYGDYLHDNFFQADENYFFNIEN